MSDERSDLPRGTTAADPAVRRVMWFDLVMAAFVAIRRLSDGIDAGISFFPLGYVVGDVTAGVYGDARVRRCIRVGTAVSLSMAVMNWVIVALPPSPDRGGQAADDAIFGQAPRFVFAVIAAFWAGEFADSFVRPSAISDFRRRQTIQRAR